MDFTFGVEPRANTSWVEPRDVTLRAPSLEQKLTWKNILDQRIKSSKLQHERFMMSKQNFVWATAWLNFELYVRGGVTRSRGGVGWIINDTGVGAWLDH